MKVGLLTFHWPKNYGAVLQAYALQQEMTALGHDVEIINYICPQYQSKWYGDWGLSKGIQPKFIAQRLRFAAFRRRFLTTTRQVFSSSAELRALTNRYDAVVVGSDQVWNGAHFRGCNPSYFLDFLEGVKCRRISYAACFGEPEQTLKNRETAAALLPKFNHLSVRNEMSQKLVLDYAGINAPIVVDPTLLHDFKDLHRIAQKHEKYILAFCLSDCREKLGRQLVETVKCELKLPVVTVWLGNEPMKNVINANGAGPLQWLNLFYNASFICTDSFHGSVFAVKFAKPFFSWEAARPVRLRDFMSLCGIKNRLISEQNVSSAAEWIREPIDFNEVNKKLSAPIQQSRIYLQHALT